MDDYYGFQERWDFNFKSINVVILHEGEGAQWQTPLVLCLDIQHYIYLYSKTHSGAFRECEDDSRKQNIILGLDVWQERKKRKESLIFSSVPRD